MNKPPNHNPHDPHRDPLPAFEIGLTVLILAALYGALRIVAMLLAAGG